MKLHIINNNKKSQPGDVNQQTSQKKINKQTNNLSKKYHIKKNKPKNKYFRKNYNNQYSKASTNPPFKKNYQLFKQPNNLRITTDTNNINKSNVKNWPKQNNFSQTKTQEIIVPKIINVVDYYIKPKLKLIKKKLNKINSVRRIYAKLNKRSDPVYMNYMKLNKSTKKFLFNAINSKVWKKCKKIISIYYHKLQVLRNKRYLDIESYHSRFKNPPIKRPPVINKILVRYSPVFNKILLKKYLPQTITRLRYNKIINYRQKFKLYRNYIKKNLKSLQYRIAVQKETENRLYRNTLCKIRQTKSQLGK